MEKQREILEFLSMKEWAGRRTAARRGGTPGQVCLVSAVSSLFLINSALFVAFSKQVNDTLLDCEHKERAAGCMRCAQDAMMTVQNAWGR